MVLLFSILSFACWLLSIAVLIRVVFSWVAPRSYGNPIYRISYDATEWMLRPIRNLFPPSQLDLSPAIALIGLWLLGGLFRSF